MLDRVPPPPPSKTVIFLHALSLVLLFAGTGKMDVLRITDIIKNSKAEVVSLQGLARNVSVHPNGATLSAEKVGVDQVRG